LPSAVGVDSPPQLASSSPTQAKEASRAGKRANDFMRVVKIATRHSNLER
jgi:hypothetical protein